MKRLQFIKKALRNRSSPSSSLPLSKKQQQAFTNIIQSYGKIKCNNYAVHKLTMPSLSPTMNEGEIVNWLKKEGDSIQAGDPICEIRTDKSVLEFEATDEGILGKIILGNGSKGVKIGSLIAYLVDKKEEINQIPTTTSATEEQQQQEPKVTTTTQSQPSTSTSGTTTTSTSGHHQIPSHSAPFSPAVLHILNENTWIDPNKVKATGRGGRITKTDLVEYMEKNSATSTSQQQTTATTTSTTQQQQPVVEAVKQQQQTIPKQEVKTTATTPIASTTSIFTDIETTQIRKIIASRLKESKQTIPHSYYSMDVRIDKLLNIKNKLQEQRGVKVSVNDIIIYCSAKALERVPECNVIFNNNGDSQQMSNIDISVAVATPTGLITPIVKNTNTKSIEQISQEVKELGKKAKENKLKPEEFQGGTFCISNLGMFGIGQFSAVVNPPHGIILAIGTSEKRPVLPTIENIDDLEITSDKVEDNVEFGTFMSVTASCDARAIDGQLAGKFMKALREELEFSWV
ncbi:hypothetical protein ABK040_015889 [Willaertia magna]